MQRNHVFSETLLDIIGFKNDIYKGDCYQEGKIVPKDLNKAREYYVKAVNQNNPEGYARLAELAKETPHLESYYLGKKYILEKNWLKAQSAFEKADELNQHSPSIYELGWLYTEDRHFKTGHIAIKKDTLKAGSLYRRAAKTNGYAYALDALEKLCQTNGQEAFITGQMYEAQGNASIAIRFYLLAAKNNYPLALPFLNNLRGYFGKEEILEVVLIHNKKYATIKIDSQATQIEKDTLQATIVNLLKLLDEFEYPELKNWIINNLGKEFVYLLGKKIAEEYDYLKSGKREKLYSFKQGSEIFKDVPPVEDKKAQSVDDIKKKQETNLNPGFIQVMLDQSQAKKLIDNNEKRIIEYYLYSAQNGHEELITILHQLHSKMNKAQLYELAKISAEDDRYIEESVKYFKRLEDDKVFQSQEPHLYVAGIIDGYAKKNPLFAFALAKFYKEKSRLGVVSYGEDAKTLRLKSITNYHLAFTGDFEKLKLRINEEDLISGLKIVIDDNYNKVQPCIEKMAVKFPQLIHMLIKFYHISNEEKPTNNATAFQLYLTGAEHNRDLFESFMNSALLDFKNFNKFSLHKFSFILEKYGYQRSFMLLMRKKAFDAGQPVAGKELEKFAKTSSEDAFIIAELYAGQVFPQVTMSFNHSINEEKFFENTENSSHYKDREWRIRAAVKYYLIAAQDCHQGAIKSLEEKIAFLNSKELNAMALIFRDTVKDPYKALKFFYLANGLNDASANASLQEMTKDNVDNMVVVAELYSADVLSLEAETNVSHELKIKIQYYKEKQKYYYFQAAKHASKAALDVLKSNLSLLSYNERLELARICQNPHKDYFSAVQLLKTLLDENNENVAVKKEWDKLSRLGPDATYAVAEHYKDCYLADKKISSLEIAAEFYLAAFAEKHEPSFQALSELENDLTDKLRLKFVQMHYKHYSQKDYVIPRFKFLSDKGNSDARDILVNMIQDDSEAAYQLGMTYLREKNPLEALNYFFMAVRHKHDKSLYEIENLSQFLTPTMWFDLANMYLNVFGNRQSALLLYKKLMGLKYEPAKIALKKLISEPEAAYEAAEMFAADNDKHLFDEEIAEFYLFAALNNYKDAFNKLVALAEAGNAAAQLSLASKYYYPKNEEQSLYWLTRVIEQDYQPAFDFIRSVKYKKIDEIAARAKKYLEDDEGEPNYKSAIAHYELLANLNHTEALYQLGSLYQLNDRSLGLKKDTNKAFSFLLRAAKSGHNAAISALESLASQVDPALELELAKLYKSSGNQIQAALHNDNANRRLTSKSKPAAPSTMHGALFSNGVKLVIGNDSNANHFSKGSRK